MWDPRRLTEDRTPPPLKDAPRPASERPLVTLPEPKAVSPYRPKRRDALKVLGFKSYPAYLRSRLWFEIRRKIVARAGATCETCKTAPHEVVHHLDYEIATLKGDRLEALMAVCRKCHDDWHKRPKKDRHQRHRVFQWKHRIR
jgi:hypothetical protein